MEITGTITVIKLLWVISTGTGSMFMLALVMRSINDLRYLRRAKLNSLREYSAKTSILTYVGGLITQLLLFAAGVVSITKSNDLTPKNYAAQGIYVLISVIGTVIAAIIFERRRKMMDLIGENEEELADYRTNDLSYSSEI